ncbi:AP180 N-terminal homology domain-containing protein [Absidia repens]|uniref:AP180 N-terminal homology domain-containing protein n=1 Tax=Absidia repens TaxID=90262 RepID=A0A1X2I9A9_9FUNG|nr:AP180 N-terminal homology domain-containing protein [Absidia repens]
MEIAIRKATRLEYRPPKQKHLQTLINLTYHKPALIDEILVALGRRGRENSWIIIYKVLIIVHTLIRQGNGDQTLSRLQKHADILSIHRLKEKASAYASIRNLHAYHDYLVDRLAAFGECDMDYIKTSSKEHTGRLRQLAVAQGLLRETTIVQRQIGFCLSCKFQMDIGDNAINFNAQRLVVEDLLALFQVVNEAVVNILEHYFTMSQMDAKLALEIYKRFAQQTQETMEYLDNARKIQHELGISIPTVNHAPLSLASALEEYLNDDGYEDRRQSYIHEKQQQKTRASTMGEGSFS